MPARIEVDVARIIELYRDGASPVDIASKMDISDSTVQNRLREFGEPTRSMQEACRLRDATASSQLYRDPVWLNEQYVEHEKSCTQMGQIAGCSYDTICRWLIEYNIPRRNYSEASAIRRKLCGPYCGKDRDPDWYYDEYINKKRTTIDIGQEMGRAPETVRQRLLEFNIPIRGSAEREHLAKRNNLKISSYLLSLLEGELLGDGCLSSRSKYSARYSHGSKYRKYLVWLFGELQSQGLERTGKIGRYINKDNGGQSFQAATKEYEELRHLYDLWYPRGKKCVPDDLVLTPIRARQWYIGDGSLGHCGNGSAYLELATCDFDRSSIDILRKQLWNLGFRNTLRPSSNTIGISAYSTPAFLDYIGPCPEEIEECYGYKWDFRKRAKRKTGPKKKSAD